MSVYKTHRGFLVVGHTVVIRVGDDVGKGVEVVGHAIVVDVVITRVAVAVAVLVDREDAVAVIVGIEVVRDAVAVGVDRRCAEPGHLVVVGTGVGHPARGRGDRSQREGAVAVAEPDFDLLRDAGLPDPVELAVVVHIGDKRDLVVTRA